MNKTEAYQNFGTLNPLKSLVELTNIFLYALQYNKHILQRQYEKLKVNKDDFFFNNFLKEIELKRIISIREKNLYSIIDDIISMINLYLT